jgi:hypothetical protein
MKHPIHLLALAVLFVLASPSALSQVEGKSANTPVPGPHVILTVPVVLTNIPPEVDQYQVSCHVRHGARQYAGSVSGAMPAVAKGPGRSFSGEVTVGITIPNATAESLPSLPNYECSLHLQGSTYGVTTVYMADGPNQGGKGLALPYGDGQTWFPLADAAPFQRIVSSRTK